MKVFSLFLVFLTTTGCLKTTEQIRAEQANVSQKEESQQMLAGVLVKVRELEEQISKTQGAVEENRHQSTGPSIEADELTQLKQEVELQKSKIEKLEEVIEDQKKYIQSVTKSLAKISKALSIN